MKYPYWKEKNNIVFKTQLESISLPRIEVTLNPLNYNN